MRYLSKVVIVVCTFAGPVFGEDYYLEYRTFRELTALAPEAPEPRLISLPDGGYQLWAQGQMRLPASGILVKGDFNQDGHPDAALIFRSNNRRYLLIATQIQNRWVRQALIGLQEQSDVTLDGNVLVLAPPETFVAWDGHQYRMASVPPTSPSVSGKSGTETSSGVVDSSHTLVASSATVSVPLHFFTGLNPKGLRSVDVRLSYRGPSTGSLPDLIFVSEEMSRKTQGGFFRSIPIPTDLVKQLLETLRKPLESSVLQTKPEPFTFLSLAIEAPGPDRTKIFQADFNHEDAKGIFLIFLRTLKGQRLAQYHLQSWGCAINLLPQGHAIDVTNRVNIKIVGSSATPWDRVSKLLQQGRAAPSDVKITVTNQSRAALDGPVSIVFNLSGNARILEPDGTTCHTSPVGREFVHLSLRNNRLLPSETIEMPASIENPEKESVVFDLKVLAGPDPR